MMRLSHGHPWATKNLLGLFKKKIKKSSVIFLCFILKIQLMSFSLYPLWPKNFHLSFFSKYLKNSTLTVYLPRHNWIFWKTLHPWLLLHRTNSFIGPIMQHLHGLQLAQAFNRMGWYINCSQKGPCIHTLPNIFLIFLISFAFGWQCCISVSSSSTKL